MLDVSRELIRYVGRLLHTERRHRGTPKRSRRLTCFHQALFALAWFRSKPNIRLHGIAFGLSQATAYRYLHEVIDVLADQAPDLHEALEHAAADRVPHLILDGKIFDTDRCRMKTTSVKGETIDAWFSGKTGDFGGNIQALCEPDGFPVWTSDVEPGGVVDIEAARRHVLPAVYPYAKAMPVLADPGYQGAGHGIVVPFKQPADGNVLSVGNRARSALQRALRSLGERGFALLTERWTALQHTTLSPSRIGDLVRAALVLVHFEHRRIS
ncbi:transposase family protein [Microtetraspora sp. NBRC 16547]|uniref:transposase family protein n=1 Tax=Microtetraspora sp. NBRC 16547 TaxID=3030993 RepID=UPI002554B48D|nr:transposase family protein [Microtetraspora sp. NBRC 16547]